MEYWSANDRVIQITNFVKSEIYRLSLLPPNPRYLRQINDGKRFLKLMASTRYAHAKTISDLRKAISSRRVSLKKLIKELRQGLPGEQMSLFENEIELSDEEIEAKKISIESCEEEVRWLHKALGICSSRNYFR